MMTRLYPGHALPQSRELTAKKWEQADPGTVPKTVKVVLVRPLMTDWRRLSERTVLFLHVGPPTTLSIKALTPCLCAGGGGDGLQTDVLHCPAQLPASEIKQAFRQTWLVYWPFEQWATEPHLPHPFSNRFWCKFGAGSCAFTAPGSPGSSRGELWPWCCIYLFVVSEPK